jgi:hypothetical protein
MCRSTLVTFGIDLENMEEDLHERQLAWKLTSPEAGIK